MEDLKELVKNILDKGYLMSLGALDEKGLWVSDVIYVHGNNFEIYWISDTRSRHSQALIRNPQVAATVTLSNNQGEENIGLQLEGKAEKIEGDILKIAIKHRLKRGKPAPKELGEILDKEESWYKFNPSNIDLIYEPKFGFN